MAVRFVAILTIILSFLSSSVRSDVIGSNISVSIEPFHTFPNTYNNDNSILAFASMQNGFALADQSTTCSFASIFPVSGTVAFNGGSLLLVQDLVFKDNTTLSSLGTVIGNNRLIDICPSITYLTGNESVFVDTTLLLRDDIIITGTIRFSGNCVIMGTNNVITLDPTCRIIVDSNTQLELVNVQLVGISDNNIACVDDTGLIKLKDVHWFQSADYHYRYGSFIFSNNVYLTGGDYTFTYESSMTSTIASESSLIITGNLSFSLGNSSGLQSPSIYFDEPSAILSFDDGNFLIGPYGTKILRGTITFDNAVEIIGTGTDASTGLMIGDGTPENDPTMYLASNGVVNHISGYIVFNTASPYAMQAGGRTSRLIRQENSIFVVQKTLVIPAVTIELVSEMVPPLSFDPGAIVLYQNSSVVLPNVEFNITSNQLNAYTYFMNGNSSILFNRGILPLYLIVAGQGNVLGGNGGMSGQIYLQDEASQIETDIFGKIDNNLYLAAGTLALQDNLRLGPAGLLVGPGNISLASNTIDLGPAAISYATPLSWNGTGGTVQINGQLSLASTWTIHGDCTINGNNNTLLLQPGGEIIIADNSSLVLKQVSVVGVEGTNIRCLGDASSINFSDSQVYLSGDYTFTVGSLYFDKINLLQTNSHSFVYDSRSTMTIADNALLRVTNGTLVLGKRTVDQENPLYMETKNADLVLDNVFWTIPSGGLQIDRGMLQFVNNNYLDIQSTSSSNGLHFGADSNDALVVDLNPGSITTQLSGHIVINMSDPDGFLSHSASAQFTSSPLSNVVIKKNTHFKNLTVDTNPYAPTVVEDNAQLTYDKMRLKLLLSDTVITGVWYNDYTTLLSDGGILDVQNGTQPQVTLVSGIGNIVQGSGSLGSDLIYTDSTSECTFGLSGDVFGNIILNGGILNLSSDLNFANDKQIIGPGLVRLNSNNINFGKSDLLATTTVVFEGQHAVLNMNGNITISSLWVFNENCEIDGRGHTLSLDDEGQILVSAGCQVSFRNLLFKNLKQSNLSCVDDTGSIVFNNVRLVQTDTVRFDTGSLLIEGEVQLYGGYDFIYSSAMSSTIDRQSTLHVLDFSNLVLNTNDPLANPLYMPDRTSSLVLDNCTLTVTGNGTTFKSGHIFCQNDVIIDIISSSTDNGLVLGDNTLQGDLSFELRPGTTLNYPRGHLLTQLINPYAINSKSKTAQIIRGAQSYFYLVNTTILQNLTLNTSQYSFLDTAPGAQLIYADVANRIITGDFDIVGAKYGHYGNILAGSNFLSLSRGIYPLFTVISGSGNIIMGNGTIAGPIIYAGPGNNATWILNGVCDSYINLYGGDLYLARDLIFGPHGIVYGPGTINLSSYTITFNPKNSQLSTPIHWIADEGTVELRSDITLSDTWLITGTCTINGNGHALDLAENGSIQVGPGSVVRFANIDIDGIVGTKIACVDDTGVIMLHNVIWHQSGDYQFNTGAFMYKGSVSMLGQNVFIYASSQTSTILEESALVLDRGFTFSYDPSSGSTDLLEFYDHTSVLELSGGVFDASGAAIELRNGSLVVSTNSYMNANSHGISFGSGVSDQDMILAIKENRQLYVNTGIIKYNNTSLASFNAYDNRVRINMAPGTGLYLYETLDLAEGNLYTDDGVTLAIAANKDLIGSVVPRGTIFRIAL